MFHVEIIIIDTNVNVKNILCNFFCYFLYKIKITNVQIIYIAMLFLEFTNKFLFYYPQKYYKMY